MAPRPLDYDVSALARRIRCHCRTEIYDFRSQSMIADQRYNVLRTFGLFQADTQERMGG